MVDSPLQVLRARNDVEKGSLIVAATSGGPFDGTTYEMVK